MKNEAKFVKTAASKLIQSENEDFLVAHYFTQFKLLGADFFIKNLEEIEKTDPSSIVGQKRNEARYYIDCSYHELMGAYDGIFSEINSAFKLGLDHQIGFIRNVIKEMTSLGSSAISNIGSEWSRWIKDLNIERNDYTHVKIRGQHIHFELGKTIEVYDRFDMINPNKKQLVTKLRDYFNKMYAFIDKCYDDLEKEL